MLKGTGTRESKSRVPVVKRRRSSRLTQEGFSCYTIEEGEEEEESLQDSLLGLFRFFKSGEFVQVALSEVWGNEMVIRCKKGFVAEAELTINKSDTTFCLGVNKAKVGELPALPPSAHQVGSKCFAES